jgi:hypothetical protein
MLLVEVSVVVFEKGEIVSLIEFDYLFGFPGGSSQTGVKVRYLLILLILIHLLILTHFIALLLLGSFCSSGFFLYVLELKLIYFALLDTVFGAIALLGVFFNQKSVILIKAL